MRTVLTDRYRWIAPVYDLVSGEPVYRAGRRRGLDLLAPAPGSCVLDVGCGTGLNFPGLLRAVGPDGLVVGLDASPEMLAFARRRADRVGGANLRLLTADATEIAPADLDRTAGRPIDAVIATYSLSLMPDWPRVWETLLALRAGPAGLRLCVVDLRRPSAGGPVARWLAELACTLGGSDIDAHPWTRLETDCVRVQEDAAWGGHLQVRVGVRNDGRRTAKPPPSRIRRSEQFE